jgi:hypothetical protein
MSVAILLPVSPLVYTPSRAHAHHRGVLHTPAGVVPMVWLVNPFANLVHYEALMEMMGRLVTIHAECLKFQADSPRLVTGRARSDTASRAR